MKTQKGFATIIAIIIGLLIIGGGAYLYTSLDSNEMEDNDSSSRWEIDEDGVSDNDTVTRGENAEIVFNEDARDTTVKTKEYFSSSLGVSLDYPEEGYVVNDNCSLGEGGCLQVYPVSQPVEFGPVLYVLGPEDLGGENFDIKEIINKMYGNRASGLKEVVLGDNTWIKADIIDAYFGIVRDAYYFIKTEGYLYTVKYTTEYVNERDFDNILKSIEIDLSLLDGNTKETNGDTSELHKTIINVLKNNWEEVHLELKTIENVGTPIYEFYVLSGQYLLVYHGGHYNGLASIIKISDSGLELLAGYPVISDNLDYDEIVKEYSPEGFEIRKYKILDYEKIISEFNQYNTEPLSIPEIEVVD